MTLISSVKKLLRCSSETFLYGIQVDIERTYVEVTIPHASKHYITNTFKYILRKRLHTRVFPNRDWSCSQGIFRTFGETDLRVFGPWEKDGGPPENHTDTERTCTLHT